ncbi:PaaI family thioesterase [Cytobacillus purgationiresistens]|uniref:Acyl-coenzyme A thioesterase THEM4 n=1 Tax=Cytobacillus purgationiresistens TaxID=863449 RepID=A0ABU0AMB6_9BACI|nr:PaaI family thioesterase [Cytobacillus purgationiresistens]MDQ0272398.1 uncharacterized protein (TIGR00369 family) [Cytobacillus purgationiresistens]
MNHFRNNFTQLSCYYSEGIFAITVKGDGVCLKEKEELKLLFNSLIDTGNEEELRILSGVLDGLKKKKDGMHASYIGGIFQMEDALYDGECELKIPLTPFVNNPLNIVHGGVIATMIDTAMGTLANQYLNEYEGAVTTQLNIHYLAPGKGSYLICKARIDHKGSKTLVLSADVYRDDGKKAAQASGSFFIVNKK